MSTLLESFRTYLLARGVAKVSVKNYISDLRRFFRWFENSFGKTFEPRNLSSDILRLFIKTQGGTITQDEVLTANSSSRSFERYLSSLRRFAEFLVEQKLIASNPFDNVKDLSAVAQALADPWHIKDFKDYLYVYGASSLTIKNYLVDINAFTSHLEEVAANKTNIKNYIELITNDLIDAYKHRLIEILHLSAKTVNRKLSSIRKYLEFAASRGHLRKQLTTDNLQLTKEVKIETKDGLRLEDFGQKENGQLSMVSGQLSRFPPIRLIQKLLAPYAFLEESIASRIAEFIKNKKLTINAGIRENQLKISVDQKIKNIPTHIPWYQKLIHHARYTRPEWYKRYHNNSFVHYLHFAILIIYGTIVGFMLYQAFFDEGKLGRALAGPITPPRILSFQGRLTDANDNPITAATDFRFIIYNSATASGSALLWQEEQHDVTPDADGIFSVLLGSKNTIPATLFRDHDILYLGITIERTPELTPRQRLAAVAYAANSQSLQGMVPITDSSAGTTNVVLALDSSGNLTIGGTATPTFSASGGRFKLSGTTLLLATEASSNGDIDIAPDGIGKIDLHKPIVNTTATGNLAGGAVEINDRFAVLATESAVAAFVVNNNTSGGDILAASSSSTTRFTLANDGDVTLTGGDTITASSLATFTTAATLGMASTTTLNCGDCIDFDDIGDSPTLDASTDINLSTLDLFVDLTSTGVFSIRDVATAYWTFDDDSTVDVVFPAAGTIGIDASTTANTTTTGVIDLNVNAGDAAVIASNIDFIANTGITAAVDEIALNINLTQNDADADMFGLRIVQAATAVTIVGTDLVECFICLENQENQATAVSDAIRITSTAATAGSINTGLDFDTTDITTDIEMQNAETIANDTNGTIGMSADSGTLTVDVNGEIQLNLNNATSSTEAVCSTVGGEGDTNTVLDDCTTSVNADYMEMYAVDEGIELGDIVIPSQTFVTTTQGNRVAKLTKSTSAYQKTTIGIVSDENQAGDFNSIGYNISEADNPKPVALNGRVPVKVTTENGPIKAGDPITSSSIPGVGMRATKAGRVVGVALESFDSDGVGKIIVFVNPTWFDPDVYLTDTGELAIQHTGNPESDPLFTENSYILAKQEADGSESVVERIGAFAKVVAANISAGFIEALRVNADEIVSPLASIDRVRTNIISPLADNSEISVTLNNSKFEIHESSASDSAVVASIDNQGNATFSGTLSSNHASISGQLATANLTANSATISGTLYADKIQASTIDGLEAKIASFAAQSVSSSKYEVASMSGEFDIASILNTGYSMLNTDFVDIQNLSTDFATFRDGLISLGPATFTQASVMDSLSIGASLIIGPNSIDTLGQTLEIEPLRQGAISFMAGRIRIETDGSLRVFENAEFASDVKVEGTLAANIISPLPNQDLEFRGDLISSGSATFGKLNFQLVQQALATSDIEAVATGSAGTAVLKQYRNEITIINPNVTPDSLIYVTPVGNTNNKVLYLLRQVAQDSISGTAGSFTVGINQPSTTTHIRFNWIIVN